MIYSLMPWPLSFLTDALPALRATEIPTKPCLGLSTFSMMRFCVVEGEKLLMFFEAHIGDNY